MANIFFLHISLTIPLLNGQCLFAEKDAQIILKSLIKNIKASRLTSKLVIVCSIDEKNLIDDILKDSLKLLPFPYEYYDIPKGFSFSFDKNNLIFNPSLLINNRPMGLFAFDFFLKSAARFSFDKALIGWADLLPAINAPFIDNLFLKAKEPLVFSYKLVNQLFLLPKQKTINLIQESVSEVIQNHKRKIRYLIENSSDKQLEEIKNQEKKLQSLFSITNKMTFFSLEKENAVSFLNPLIPVYNYSDYSDFLNLFALINSIYEKITVSAEKTIAFLQSEEFSQLSIDFHTMLKTLHKGNYFPAQRLLIDINDDNHETSLKSLKDILSKWDTTNINIIELGNFYNPLMNKELPAIISYLKDKTDFLILNIRNIKNNISYNDLTSAENLILNFRITTPEDEKLLARFINEKNAGPVKIFIETILTKNNEYFIHDLFCKYEFLADNINVLPMKPPYISFAENSKICTWAKGTIVLNSRGDFLLCEENPFIPEKQDINSICALQGEEAVCSSCSRKSLKSSLWQHDHETLLLTNNEKQFSLLQLFLPIIYHLFSTAKNSTEFILPLFSFLKGKQIKADKEIQNTLLNKMFMAEQYKDMLTFAEEILKADPLNKNVWELINSVEKKFKTGA